jgi:hypothetical protein
MGDAIHIVFASHANVARQRRCCTRSDGSTPRREIGQATLRTIERRAFLAARDNVLGLERLRHNAGRRLSDLSELGSERFRGEEEAAWAALAFVADQMPRATATFTVIGFADQETRTRFASNPEQRAAIVNACLDMGAVYDAKNHFVGMVL